MLRRTKGLHQLVVAYLALFIALGGSAVAAKSLIDGSHVQDESLTGADIQNESLTGDDILESSLGKVSSATSADIATYAPRAGDASTLDGKDSTDFLGANSKAADSDKLDGKDSTQFLRSVQTAIGTEATATPGASATSRADCPPGTMVTGGGYVLRAGHFRQFHVYRDSATPGTNNEDVWEVLANNSSTNEDMKYRAYARCAS